MTRSKKPESADWTRLQIKLDASNPHAALPEFVSHLRKNIACAFANKNRNNTRCEDLKVLEYCRDTLERISPYVNDMLLSPYASVRGQFRNRAVLELLFAVYLAGVHGAASQSHANMFESMRQAKNAAGPKRRESRSWLQHATELAKNIQIQNPGFSQAEIAHEISERWKLEAPRCPKAKTLEMRISELQASGEMQPRVVSRAGSGG